MIDKKIKQLRELKGINTSFDYGIELLILNLKGYSPLIKSKTDLESITNIIERRYANIFQLDKVCKRGYELAKTTLLQEE